MRSTAVSSTKRRGFTVAAAVAIAAIGLVVTGTSAAQQANADSTRMPPATPTDGWMRVAHLSPDTKAVDVTLTAAKGGQTVVSLDKVGYGTVSQYIHIPAGVYVVAMRPWKASTSTKPLISASVDIVKGKTITVAAFGLFKDLKTRVFQDDLAAPSAKDARIRLIQASTITKSVDVKTSTGIVVADNAAQGQATDYASVPAGTWTLDLSSPKVSDASAVTLKQGSVNTLFVLDNASGGLSVKSVLDSASVGTADPVGGVNTGGGWASSHPAFDVFSGNQ
jgi:hypothetical protein